MAELGAAERGCLLLADITGYTEYMTGTELTHAQDVVADLLETIIGTIEPTFMLSKLEGDAAFAYASASEASPSMMMDTIESAYFSFQRRLRDIVHSTTCECDACVRTPDLDLKFFVHDGEYVVRRIARSEELTGPDVILVHRLAKGSSGQKINRPAFVVYTKNTLDSMAMDPTILGFVAHTEVFDDLGEVEVFIQDLAVRWTFEQERNRDYISSGQAIYENSVVTPAAPSVVWDYLTDPTKRPLWQHLVTEVLSASDGRQQTGSVNHCMHGDEVLVEHVADWRPFSYITLRYDGDGLDRWAWMYELTETEAGTELTTRLSNPGDDVWEAVSEEMIERVDRHSRQIAEVIENANLTE